MTQGAKELHHVVGERRRDCSIGEVEVSVYDVGMFNDVRRGCGSS